MEKMYKVGFYSKKIKEVSVVRKTFTMVEYLDDDNLLQKERKKTNHYCFAETREEAIKAMLKVLETNVRNAESRLAFYQNELDAFLAANVIDQNSPS
jgi:hypothetical protein